MFKHALLIFFALVIWLQAPTGLADDWRGSDITQLVMLGTGTPNPFPDRAGPSLAIVVNGEPYLVDFGPGVVRQASSLSPEYGGEIEGLAVENLKHAFLTHLHSDHTVGLPDLILTAWTVGRDSPLKLFGPEGTEHMADKVLEAYEEDIRYRLYSEQPANNQGWRVETQEVTESGLIFKDENVTVEAFSCPTRKLARCMGISVYYTRPGHCCVGRYGAFTRTCKVCARRRHTGARSLQSRRVCQERTSMAEVPCKKPHIDFGAWAFGV